MTTEFVLLLGLYTAIILGAFLGESGPIQIFDKASPRLGVRVERDIATGTGFYKQNGSQRTLRWEEAQR